MGRRVVVMGLLVLGLFLPSGCAVGEGPGQAGPQSLQLQWLEIGVEGTVGPRHGPYGR
jgi:hypothetical protein